MRFDLVNLRCEIIVLIGPHAAGKSSLGRILSEMIGLPFDEEIGWTLAQDPAFRTGTADASCSQPDFDREVIRRELCRDEKRKGMSRIVETWHPGNLAYAANRNGWVIEDRLNEIRRSVGRQSVVAVPVAARPAELAIRKHEPGDPAFFLKVGNEARDWCEVLGIPTIEPVMTDREDSDRLAARLLEALTMKEGSE